jgi:hypothetical protein
MSLGSGFGMGIGTGQPGSYASGPADGNYPGQGGSSAAAGSPNFNHNAVIVGVIVIAAIALLAMGVIGLRAAGEVVI